MASLIKTERINCAGLWKEGSHVGYGGVTVVCCRNASCHEVAPNMIQKVAADVSGPRGPTTAIELPRVVYCASPQPVLYKLLQLCCIACSVLLTQSMTSLYNKTRLAVSVLEPANTIWCERTVPVCLRQGGLPALTWVMASALACLRSCTSGRAYRQPKIQRRHTSR